MLLTHLHPIQKNSNKGVRPIACGEVVYRIAASLAIEKISVPASSILLPNQFGVAIPGGSELIIHSLQHSLEPNPLANPSDGLSAISVDFKNAFNSISRQHCLNELTKFPELQSLYRLANFAYGTPSPLFCTQSDKTIIHSINSEEGMRQGDPLGSFLFCLGLNPVINAAKKETLPIEI